jgi:hypothetical protein
VGLPDGQHQGLWPEQTAPYPPLGILFFAPIAGLERAGDLSPGHAHSLAVGLLVLIACLACLAGGQLARRSTRLFQLGFLLLGDSLLFGAGANGFFDVLYCLAGFLGLEALAKGRNAHALAFFALAGSLHFRAAVLLPAAGFALWRGLAGPDRRRTLWVLAISCLALAPVACAALVLDTDAFVVVNPIRVKLIRTFAFAALAAAGMALALSRRRPLTALTLFCASLLLYADALHCWWHALVLLFPPLVAAVEDGWTPESPRLGPALWLWTFAVALVAYRDPWPPFWEWLRWALLRWAHP